MLNDFENEVKNFNEWFIEIKGLLLLAEELDLNGKVYFQPYNELRYALDHFNRAILSEINNEDKSKIQSAIKSATNHLQRAYSDTFEWYYLTIKSNIYNTLKPYSQQQIITAIPNYFSVLRPKLDEVGNILTVYKENKSSEKNSLIDEEKGESNDITISPDYINELKSINNTIRNAESALIEIKIKEQRHTIFEKILIPIIVGAVGFVLGSLILR